MTILNLACLFVAWLVSLGAVWSIREPAGVKTFFILLFLGLSLVTIGAGIYLAIFFRVVA